MTSRHLITIALCLLGCLFGSTLSSHRRVLVCFGTRSTCPSPSGRLFMSSKSKKSGKKAGGSGVPPLSAAGFGLRAKTKDSPANIETLMDSKTLEFVRWTEQKGGKIQGLAVARSKATGLRGLVALKPFKKNDIIISIPYESAIDLTEAAGVEILDPFQAGLALLRLLSDENVQKRYRPYFDSLPKKGDSDVESSTLFWDRSELDLLQFPLAKAETLRRQTRIKEMADSAGVDEGDLRWAVWIVFSRVLSLEDAEGKVRQVLIPYFDFANHKSGSKHIPSGRAALGSQLKLIAGEDIPVGDDIVFSYGAGMTSSDHLLQDYGFLEPSGTAQSDKILLAKLPNSYKEGLKDTSIQEDEAALQGEDLSPKARLAIEFRLHLKKLCEQDPSLYQ